MRGDVADAGWQPLSSAPPTSSSISPRRHDVDRSILSAGEFITTDVFGTFVLLEAARRATHLKRVIRSPPTRCSGSVRRVRSPEDRRTSRATLFGQQGRLTGSPTATSRPTTFRSSSASLEQLRSVSVPRKSHSALCHQPARRPLRPALRRRGQIRDWLHVNDHCRGIDLLIDAGTNGEVYNIGAAIMCGTSISRTGSSSSPARPTR